MITRRGFLAAGAATAGLVSTLGAPAVRAAGKAKKYRTALVGSGWWGMNILSAAIQSGTADAVALVDVDQRQLEQALKKVREMTGSTPKTYGDYREMLDAQKPEIVICATPDHWHPLVTIDAVKSGAHVYVEKPVSHTILEGAAMLKAARGTGRKVQVGTHRRVSPANMAAMEFLKSGGAGKIGMIRAFVHYQGGPGSKTPDSEIPKGLDWDKWCGPAPYVPYNQRIHPKGFRSFLEFANGQLGDWGVHWMDQINWWTGDNRMPTNVSSVGGRMISQDNTNAPDTMSTHFQFDDFVIAWEHRQFAGNGPEHHNVGCYFYGTKGTLHLGWIEGATFYPSADVNAEPAWHADAKLHEPDQQNIPELWSDFIDSIENDHLPFCDIEKGFRSTVFSLLGMLSLKIGRSVRWDHDRLECVGDAEATKLLRREYRKPYVYPEV
ncbi:MAG: Gfo/Idh/MocA family oxidoreductase [Planctomycetaceae bacterium]|nr:Gfo/Idh/MocA family oxidoreductase [Planctomycetaceae bacterium]